MESNETLVMEYKEGNKQALDKIIRNNKGIVGMISNKYYKEDSLISIEDIEQVGYLGLIEAVNRYDLNHEKKAKFITYAVHWINREIVGFLFGKSTKDVGNLKFNSKCTSTNIKTTEDSNVELEQLVPDEEVGYEYIIEEKFFKGIRNELENVMTESITLRNREILKLIYGWNSSGMSRKDIAELFNISSVRVGQIENESLRSIRNSKWARKRAREFYELGYISKEYLGIFRRRGLILE